MKQVTLALLVLTLVGCVPDQGATNLTIQTQEQIKKGETTKQEIVSMLGQPQNQSQDQYTEMYGYVRTINMDGKITRYALSVYMDKQGIVRNFVFVQGNN